MFTNPVTVTVNVASVNDAPVLNETIATQYGREEDAFSYTLPNGLFSDQDGDTLTYSATLSDASGLPAWLSFNADTKVFSGTPPHGARGMVNIKVTANDEHGGTSSAAFGISLDTGAAYVGQVINGTDPFTSSQWLQVKTDNADSFKIADMDNDSYQDIVADFGASGMQLYNPVTGVWSNLFTNNADSFEISDFNKDGYKDIVADLGSAGLWLVSGAGNSQLLTNNVQQFQVTDFNNDGSLDAVVDIGSPGLYLYQRSGATSQLVAADAISLQLADYNNDGKQDIIADFANVGLYYINNNLTTTKQIKITYNGQSTAIHPTQFQVVDITPGGNKEIVFAFGDHMYIENGSTNAAMINSPITGLNILEFGIADLNGDNRLDIFTSLSFGGNITYYGNQSGGFDTGSTSIGGSVISNVKFADWNNDGRTDVIANHSGIGLSVMDGVTQNWTTLNDKIAENYEVKDITGDGKLDIIADFGANGMSVFDRYHVNNGEDVLTGSVKDDTIHGLSGNDTINGGDGWDSIYGDAGNDAIDGGNGNDIIAGGLGTNVMTGGLGADTFIIEKRYSAAYNAATNNHSGEFDIITDFNPAVIGERIDISAFQQVTGLSQLTLRSVAVDGVSSTAISIADPNDATKLNTIIDFHRNLIIVIIHSYRYRQLS